ncbi:MAG: NAD(P)H-hydrate dehydratase [Bacteroidota bacterium]
MRHLDLCTPVYSTAAMREADRATMEDFGIPGFTLMETAARGAVHAIVERYGPMKHKNVLVLAGKGNNGGDGLAIARLLYGLRARVLVVTNATEENATPETVHNLRLLRRLSELEATRWAEVEAPPEWSFWLQIISVDEELDPSTLEQQIEGWSYPDLTVDALLGIGQQHALREPIHSLVWESYSLNPVVSVDVPTGINSDTGEAIDEEGVLPELTVTMGRPKVGLLFGDGRFNAGDVVTVDISIPRHIEWEVMQKPGCAYLPTDAFVSAALPGRGEEAHKYEVGMALVVAGSNGYTGAAVLAAQAAAKIGAGYVVCATTPDAQRAIDAHAPVIATLGLPTTESGGIAESALDTILDRAEKAKSVLIGPGLGRDAETVRLVHRLLDALATDFPDTPIVLDADGLNALADTDANVWQIAHRYDTPRLVLTPHLGEFRRLVAGSGGNPDNLDLNRRTWIVPEWAATWNAVLLLKGAPSVIGQPDDATFVAASVNSALATAGSGDVLAGSIAGLLAQGAAPAEATVCALHLGLAAADRYTATRDGRSMQASDLIELLPQVMHDF